MICITTIIFNILFWAAFVVSSAQKTESFAGLSQSSEPEYHYSMNTSSVTSPGLFSSDTNWTNTSFSNEQVSSQEWGYWGWLDHPEYHYHNERCDLMCQTYSHPYYPYTGFRVYQQFEMAKVFGLFPLIPKISTQMVFCYRGIVTSTAETIDEEREYLEPDYEEVFDNFTTVAQVDDIPAASAYDKFHSGEVKSNFFLDSEGMRVWGRVFCITKREPFRPDVRGCYKLARRNVWKSRERNFFLRETNAGALFKCHGCPDGRCKRQNRIGPEHDDFWCNSNDQVTPSAPLVADEPYAGIFEVHNPWKFLYRQPLVYTPDYYNFMYPRKHDRYAAYIDINEKYESPSDSNNNDDSSSNKYKAGTFSVAEGEELSDIEYNLFKKMIKPHIPGLAYDMVLEDVEDESYKIRLQNFAQNVGQSEINYNISDTMRKIIPETLMLSLQSLTHSQGLTSIDSLKDISPLFSSPEFKKVPKTNRIIMALGAMPDRFKAMKLYNLLLNKSTDLSHELSEWGAVMEPDGTIHEARKSGRLWYEALINLRKNKSHGILSRRDNSKEEIQFRQEIYKIWDDQLESQLAEFYQLASAVEEKRNSNDNSMTNATESSLKINSFIGNSSTFDKLSFPISTSTHTAV